MTTYINIGIADPSGVDTRDLFPSLSMGSDYSANAGAQSFFKYSADGHSFKVVPFGTNIATGGAFSQDLSGIVTQLDYYIDGGQTPSATIAISDTAGEHEYGGLPINSFAEMTPNSLANPISLVDDVVLEISGGEGNDKLFGSDYSDMLFGGLGHDVVTGFGGSDQFVLSPSKGDWDHVMDFQHNIDEVSLRERKHLPATLDFDKAFHDITKSGMSSEERDDRFLYDRNSGKLYYDDDGSKAHGDKAFVIAVFDNHAHLTADDFSIYTPDTFS